MKQRSDEWFQARSKCSVTGSAVSKILGNNPYGGWDEALREKVRSIHGAEQEFTGNIATDWGEAWEATALQQYEVETGNLVDEYGFLVHREYKWIGYSPDGVSGNHLIEIKCPYSQKIPAVVPGHYMDQVQLGMEVMNLPYCDFIYWTPNEMKVFHVERDHTWFKDHLHLLMEFNDTVLSEFDNPVHLEPLIKDMDASTEWAVLVKAYKDAEEDKANAEDRMKGLKQSMVKLSGGVSAKGAGITLSKVVTKGRVQLKNIPGYRDREDALIEELTHGDLDSYRTKPSESWRLTKEKA